MNTFTTQEPTAPDEAIARATSQSKADGASAYADIQTHTDEGKPRPQAAVLIDIGHRHVLFHDNGGDAYAKVGIGTRTAVMAVGGSEYRDVLAREYYALTDKGANRNAVGDAISTLSAVAKYSRGSEPVYLRVAETDTGIEIDMGDDTGGSAIITKDGWTIGKPTVNFRRSGKPLALPRPENAADFSLLWNHINVAREDRPLVAAWLLAALRPRGPYPILLLIGEQGTGKSVTSRMLKRLTDPSAVMLRPPPREDRDLQVASVSSWVVAMDNLSGINATLSDCLCRIATGGGFAGRKLFTDADETLIEVQRPAIINGIDDIANRPDLADRCLHLLLPPLTTRRTEREVEAGFLADAPAIFAALLDGLVLATRDHASVHLDRLPRMADFATWAAAGLPALGFSADEFISAYTNNRDSLSELALEASPVASALLSFMSGRDIWTGSSADLLGRLTDASPGAAGGQAWPKSAKGLMGALRRVAPALRAAGITVEHRRTNTRNVVEVCKSRLQAPQVPHVPPTPFDGGACGAYAPADAPQAPPDTGTSGACGTYGGLKPTLHEPHPATGEGDAASEYAYVRGEL